MKHVTAAATALLWATASLASEPPAATVVSTCVTREMRVPRDLVPHMPATVTIRFVVAGDGTPGPIAITPAPASPRIAAVIERAVKACSALAQQEKRSKSEALPQLSGR